jgi:hypothetical protein
MQTLFLDQAEALFLSDEERKGRAGRRCACLRTEIEQEVAYWWVACADERCDVMCDVM